MNRIHLLNSGSQAAATSTCGDGAGLAPTTLLHTSAGPLFVHELQAYEHRILAVDGSYHVLTGVVKAPDGEASTIEIVLKHASSGLRLGCGDKLVAVRGVPLERCVKATLARLKRGLLKEEWVTAARLCRGDYVGTLIPTLVSDAEIDQKLCWLYGVMLGNGHIVKGRKEAGVTSHKENGRHLQEKLRTLLAEMGVHFWENEIHGSCSQIKWTHEEAIFGFGPRHLYDLKNQKHIHPDFMHLPHSKVLPLIEGLLKTDGNISRGSEVTFSTSSRALGEGLRFQLLRLGVPTHSYIRQRKMDHTGTRRDGSKATFRGDSFEMKIAVPMIRDLAEIMGTPPLRKFNWFAHGGKVFTRVKQVEFVRSHDRFQITLENDIPYCTVDTLVHNAVS